MLEAALTKTSFCSMRERARDLSLVGCKKDPQQVDVEEQSQELVLTPSEQMQNGVGQRLVEVSRNLDLALE